MLCSLHYLLTDPENNQTIAKVDTFHLKGSDYKTLNHNFWLSNEVKSTALPLL